MIGKLIVHRPTRAEAIAAMKRALSEFHIAPDQDDHPAPPRRSWTTTISRAATWIRGLWNACC
jgi:biotin carboxylase